MAGRYTKTSDSPTGSSIAKKSLLEEHCSWLNGHTLATLPFLSFAGDCLRTHVLSSKTEGDFKGTVTGGSQETVSLTTSEFFS